MGASENMQDNLGLREFMNRVQDRLKTYSLESLTNILLDWAVKTPPAKREEFLNKLSPPITEEIGWKSDTEFLEEIKAFGKRVEDGSYGEAQEEDDDFYDEEQADESWASEVDDFMQEAHDCMTEGKYDLARDAYAMLFRILESGEESLHLPGSYDPLGMLKSDINEARSSYLLSIYFSSPERELPANMLDGMQYFSRYVGEGLNIRSVVNAGLEPFPAYDEFLKSWIDLLSVKKEGWARYLLREAVVLSAGMSGIMNLARRDGKNHPSAYIEWIRMLEKEEDFSGMEKAAMEGLENVPRDYVLRAKIGEYLAIAGEHLGNRVRQLYAFHEAFYSDPSLDHLLSLLRVMEGVNSYQNEISISLSRVRSLISQRANNDFRFLVDDRESKKSSAQGILLVETLLLGGRHKEAHDIVIDEKSLGWSYGPNPKGLVLTFFLKLLSKEGGGKPVPNIKLVWKDLIDSIAGFPFQSKERISLSERFSNAMEDVIRSVNLTGEERAEYTRWCIEETGKRVDAIVGEKHRNSYNKAAALLVATAEMLEIQKDRKTGEDLVDEYRNKYHRHSAFQSELSNSTFGHSWTR